jgi:hypothetical protein
MTIGVFPFINMLMLLRVCQMLALAALALVYVLACGRQCVNKDIDKCMQATTHQRRSRSHKGFAENSRMPASICNHELAFIE